MAAGVVAFVLSMTGITLQAADPAAADKAATGTVAVAQTATAQAPQYLSMFTNGIGKGMHAVYTTPTFDALMQSNGYVMVYPKDKGVRVGKPLTMGPYIFYRGNVTTVGRAIMTFENDKGPLMNPATVELKGKLEDDVDYSLTYAFDKTGVSVRGYGKDPKGLTPPTIFRLAIWVPGCTNFPPETLQADREAKLRGLAFVIRSGQKKTVYPYANGAVYAAPAEKCWIEGPVYGARKLSFEVKASDSAPMYPWIYDNAPPHNGYIIYMHKSSIESKKPGERLVLNIQ
jgi:hypothetical protein